MFFSLVIGVYGAYIRFFMPRQLGLGTTLVAIPILFLHFEYWRHMAAATTSIMQLGLQGRLLNV